MLAAGKDGIGMDLFAFSQTTQAVLALLTVAGMFVLFLREAYPTEVVAIGGVAVLLFLGVLPYQAALDVLSNPAPWTIAAMFIVMGALVRPGGLSAFTALLLSTSDAAAARATCQCRGMRTHHNKEAKANGSARR